MRLTKKVPYKLKQLKTFVPALGLAGASLLSGCEQQNEPVLKQHDTVYTFGNYDWFTNEEQEQIVASADSATVRYVIFESDGKPFSGTPVSNIRVFLNRPLKKMTEENKKKVKGCGILSEVVMNSVEDSIYLANMGFVFGYTFKPEYQKQR